MKWIFNAVDLAHTVIVGGVRLGGWSQAWWVESGLVGGVRLSGWSQTYCLYLYDVTEVCVCWEVGGTVDDKTSMWLNYIGNSYQVCPIFLPAFVVSDFSFT